MSQHKTGLSNWSAKQKSDYWDRRDKGLRGQTGAVTVYQTTLTDKGSERIPLGGKLGQRFFNRWQAGNAWRVARGPQQTFVKQQRKATSRGE